jgi:hypothetical protein
MLIGNEPGTRNVCKLEKVCENCAPLHIEKVCENCAPLHIKSAASVYTTNKPLALSLCWTSIRDSTQKTDLLSIACWNQISQSNSSWIIFIS